MNHTAENRLKLLTAVAACLMVGLLAGCTAPPAQPEPPAVDRSAQPVSLVIITIIDIINDIYIVSRPVLHVEFISETYFYLVIGLLAYMRAQSA